MEKKKKTVANKKTNIKKKNVKKDSVKKKKGFTLIELLAVIIILGILMIIAIPSVTSYINDSRKNAYVDTAKEIISGARNLVNEGKDELYDENVTYYIDANCIKTEGALKSPYGEFVKAYVAVTYNGNGYDYYWTSVDEAGEGFRGLVKTDKLDSDLIESDLKSDDISLLRGIGGRTNVQVIDSEHGCVKGNTEEATSYVNSSGEDAGAILYPSGKEDNELSLGDIVRIGDQEFYFVKYDNGHKVLFARYNLKVGKSIEVVNNSYNITGEFSESDPGYGLQSSEVIGRDGQSGKGTVAFSSSHYWGNKTFPEYIYNSSSNLYQYFNYYKNYLEKLGATVVEARAVSWEEVWLFVNNGLVSLIDNSIYWTGTASDYNVDNVIIIYTNNRNGSSYFSTSTSAGVRPVIVIE